MWRRWLLDYFSFSRRERMGVLALVLVIGGLVVAPAFWRNRADRQDPAAYRELAPLLTRQPALSDAKEKVSPDSFTEISPGARRPATAAVREVAHFYFDPNTLPAEGWVRLGVRERTAATIRRYVEKGGSFRRPEDLHKVYGLHEDEVARLIPWVRLATRSGPPVAARPGASTADRTGAPHFTRKDPAIEIDVNAADSADWTRLPGIGVRLAARIMRFRERLGGFYSPDQVGETFGLPDSVFRSIRPRLHVGNPRLRTLALNTAGDSILRQHPYIRWMLARTIVRYREQHGGFSNIEELRQLALLPDSVFQKLKPYLVL